MSEISKQIQTLGGKVQQLLMQYDMLQKENEKLRAGLRKAGDDEHALLQKIEDLKEQNLIIKASMQELSGSDKKELLKKINSHIRNIDNCIIHLSK